jgi:outer membrane protein TolC
MFCTVLASSLSLVLLAAAGADRPPDRLTLEQAVRQAVERHEAPAAARERARAADARLSRARATFFPELLVGGSYTRRLDETVRNVGGQDVVIQSRNALSAVAQLRLQLFDARAFPLLGAAARDREASHLEADEIRRRTAFAAAAAFVGALSADQVALAAEQRTQLARKNLEDVEGRLKAKLVSSNDLTLARLELSTAEREQVRARGEARQARLALEVMVHAPVPEGLDVPEPVLAEAERPPEAAPALVAQARAGRRDAQALRKRVEALESLALEPRARLIPTLSLLGQYRVTNESGLSGRTGDGFAAFDLAWPLFDGGERYAERAEREALAAAARAEADLLDRELEAEVQSAVVILVSAQDARRHAELAAHVADQNVEETRLLYQRDLVRGLDVLNAAVRRFEAQVALARERYGLLLAYLGLRQALGMEPL